MQNKLDGEGQETHDFTHLCHIKQKATENKHNGQKPSQADSSMVVTSGEGGGRRMKRVKGIKHVMTGGDQSLGGWHTVLHTAGVSQNCAPETYTVLLIDVSPINLILKIKKKPHCIKSSNSNNISSILHLKKSTKFMTS